MYLTGETDAAVQAEVAISGTEAPAVGAAAIPTLTNPCDNIAGQYSEGVLMSDTTPGAAIHYTTDGTTPTAASLLYVSQFAISQVTTFKAIAVASGYANSAVATVTFQPTCSNKITI